jgi:poly(A) polymerase Pap1
LKYKNFRFGGRSCFYNGPHGFASGVNFVFLVANIVFLVLNVVDAIKELDKFVRDIFCYFFIFLF